MISSTAVRAWALGFRSLKQGSSGGRRLRAPTPRRAQPGRSPRATGARAGERHRARSSSPSSPATAGLALPALSRLPSDFQSQLGLTHLTPPNPHPGVWTHRCSSPPQTARSRQTSGGGEALAPAAAEKSASGCKRPLFWQAGVGQVKECAKKGPPRGSKEVP